MTTPGSTGRRNRDARWFWYDETERLEAENARLRAALTRIAEQPASVPLGTPWKHWCDIAREALEGSDG